MLNAVSRRWLLLFGVLVCALVAGCLIDSRKPCLPCTADAECRASERCVKGYCEPNDFLYRCPGSLPEGTITDAGPQEKSPEQVCSPGQSEPCYSGPAGTEGKGLCKQGLRYCLREGTWGGCLGEILPSQERCDGRDNDCDGLIDQTFSELGKSCRVGQGACEATGTQVCSPDGKLAVCDAVAGEPKTEQCNGVDDDCDGKTDEGLVRSCYTGPASSKGFGLCRDGKQTCEKGVWGTCAGEVLPDQEICDQRDNNCDGQVDEGCTCIAGEQQVCYSGPLGSENVGLCREGLQRCGQDRRWGPCLNGIVPALETCDGQDNDCDGNIDESFPEKEKDCQIPQRTGRCAQGTYLCRGNALLCVSRYSTSQEICDGQDNDCDGLTDETFPLLGSPCVVSQQQGACKDGSLACVGGRSTCVPLRQPLPESCNGLDDDCDGSIDFGCAWVLSAGGEGDDSVSSLSMDPQRQILSSGSFSNTARFGSLSPVLAAGAQNAFFAGIASQGAFSWVVAARSSEFSEGIGITADTQGGLYVVGHFRKELKLGTHTFSTITPQDQAVFFARISASGAVAWAQSADSNQKDSVVSVHADEKGRVVTAGLFQGTEFQIASRLIQNPLPGKAQAWVASFDSTGALGWAQKIVGTTEDVSVYALYPSLRGAFFLLGSFVEKLTFEDGSSLQGPAGKRSVFVVGFDATGKILFSKAISGAADVEPRGLAVSDIGEVFVAGRFAQSLQVPPLAPLQTAATSALFVTKLDASGQFVWARVFTAQEDVTLREMRWSAQRLFVLGEFVGSLQVDGVGVNALHTEKTQSMYLAYLDAQGQARWFTSASSPSGKAVHARSLWLDGAGNAYVGALISAETQCGGTLVSLTGKQQDLLVWKISRP
ncbi:MAG: putative metal-binding motif-containing protein [Myxococcales bacterium]|nr:putative metal-binding motif-containing protein [Myxococcales bacterium]